jgi:gas vesicle protein
MGRCKRCSIFLLGAGIGAAACIALAPKSGRDVREELFGHQGDVLGEPGSETEQPDKSEAELKEDLQQKIEETRERLRAEIEAQEEG